MKLIAALVSLIVLNFTPILHAQEYVARINLKFTQSHTNEFRSVFVDTRDLIEFIAEEVGYTNSLSNLELVIDLSSEEVFFLYVVDKTTGEPLTDPIAAFDVGMFAAIEREFPDGTGIGKYIMDTYYHDLIFGVLEEDHFIGQAFGKLLVEFPKRKDTPAIFLNFLIQGGIYGSFPETMVQGTIITIRKFVPTDPPLVLGGN